MISRGFQIALLVSLAAHILIMSVVTIVTPDDVKRMRPYTRIDFLGSILRKTAFEVMLENIDDGSVRDIGRRPGERERPDLLAADVRRSESIVSEFPEYQEKSMERAALGSLTGRKEVPGFGMRFGSGAYALYSDDNAKGREILYRPAPPYVMKGLYGRREMFRMKVKVLVDRDGRVKNVEPLTTTGYPEVDIMALKFVKGWIYEPDRSPGMRDESLIVDILLNSGE
ncbi:MAG: TonB family protein [Candidatus Omnitrophota bacterium]